MSVTYNIGCFECKKSLWIAQTTRCFYSGDKKVMAALEDFLFDHTYHHLSFLPSEDFADMKYQEIDVNEPKEN